MITSDRYSLEEHLGVALSEPALVVGGSVFPARFELVPESPHEVALNDVVPSISSALSDVSNLLVVEVSRVNRAFAILDDRELVAAERT